MRIPDKAIAAMLVLEAVVGALAPSALWFGEPPLWIGVLGVLNMGVVSVRAVLAVSSELDVNFDVTGMLNDTCVSLGATGVSLVGISGKIDGISVKVDGADADSDGAVAIMMLLSSSSPCSDLDGARVNTGGTERVPVSLVGVAGLFTRFVGDGVGLSPGSMGSVSRILRSACRQRT